MAKKLATPCAAPKRGIPWELKYDFAIKGYAFQLKAWLYVAREEYGAAAAIKMYEKVCKIDDRIRKLTNTLLEIFHIEGNDAETIGEWHDIWCELIGRETTILERSKTIDRRRYTECPWKTLPKDICDWDLSFYNTIAKTINPKATFERIKAMCAGDPYCEYVHKIEE